jgi:hypothetical protein
VCVFVVVRACGRARARACVRASVRIVRERAHVCVRAVRASVRCVGRRTHGPPTCTPVAAARGAVWWSMWLRLVG